MYNFHTHTNFCDGSSKPEKYVEEANKSGLKALGFSGHAPVPFPNNFSLTENSILDYCQEIRRLQKKYFEKIEIFLGIEADYISGKTDSFDDFREKNKLDYIIGSVHLVKRKDNEDLWFIDGSKSESYDEGLEKLFDNNIQQAVKGYFYQINEMIDNEHFDILGHFDKITMHNKNRFFKTDEEWYKKLVLETLNFVREKQLIIEINTRGLYKKRYWDFYPETQWFSTLKKMKIPVMISTDAHDPSELQLFVYEAKMALLQAGITEQTILQKDGFRSIPLI